MNAKNTGHQGASNLGIEKLELNVVPYLKGEAAALPTVERLLRDSDCAAILGCSKATWWRRVADGTMPQPVRIGGMSRWKPSEVMAALDAICALRDG
jgi:predicted DNA-binding transcriptional regulator AlpA